MSAFGGGMNFYGEMPQSFNITVNMQNPLIAKIMETAKASIKPQDELPAEAPESATDEEKKAAREAREAVRVAHRQDVEEFSRNNEMLKQVIDLALLSNGMLKGKALADFIARSRKVVTDAYLK